MNLQPTGHCPYRLREVGDLQPILWYCPRFAPMREDWPQALRARSDWPPCGTNALICTSAVSASDRAQWSNFQALAAQLLNFWMCILRHNHHEERFPSRPDGQEPVQIGNASFTTPYTAQFMPLGNAGLLDLRWQRPTTRTKMQSWEAMLMISIYSLVLGKMDDGWNATGHAGYVLASIFHLIRCSRWIQCPFHCPV